MISLSLYRSSNAFGYALGIDAASEGMRRLWKAEDLCNVSLSLLARESVEEKGGHPWKRTDMCLDLWKNRRITCCLSILVARPLAGLVG